MPEAKPVTNLEDLLDRLEHLAANSERVSLHDVMHALGRRSYGPWLLFIGLLMLSPIGDIPTVPTMMAAVILLISVQLLLNRAHFWLPRWLLKRSASANAMKKAARWMRKPARWIDRVLRPRFEFATGITGTRVTAVLCIVIAIGMPPMELVPFTGTGAGLALGLFGIALIANDGVLAALAVVFFALTYGFVIYQLL